MRRLERTSIARIALAMICAGLLGACDDYEDPQPPTGPDPDLVGEVVTLVPESAEGLSRRKSQKIWTRDVPGSWLTHSRAGGAKTDLPAEAAEDLDTVAAR